MVAVIMRAVPVQTLETNGWRWSYRDLEEIELGTRAFSAVFAQNDGWLKTLITWPRGRDMYGITHKAPEVY